MLDGGAHRTGSTKGLEQQAYGLFGAAPSRAASRLRRGAAEATEIARQLRAHYSGHSLIAAMSNRLLNLPLDGGRGHRGVWF
jgi:hypothetical protein